MSSAFDGGLVEGLWGSSTRIGIGACANTTPHAANARTGCVRLPLNIPEKYVWTLSVTSTRMNAFGASPEGGTEPVGTPVTVVGKLTSTRFPVPSLPYPFLAAY